MIKISYHGDMAKSITKDLHQQIFDESGDNLHLIQEEGSSFGPVETIIVTVAGQVIIHVVTKLIDRLCEKKKEHRGLQIMIMHQEPNVTFILPNQAQVAKTHFTQSSK